MQQQQYILSLCQALAESGKKPSVALIKRQSSYPLPLPEILAVLQRWKKNPSFEALNTQAKRAGQPTLSLEQRVDKLESQMQQIEKLMQQLLDATAPKD